VRRILVITNNFLQASYRLRIAELIPLLREKGFELEVHRRPRKWMARRRLLKTARDYHAVILQRKFLDASDMRLLRAAARRIFYDIDDAVMLHQKPVGPIERWRTRRRFEATAANVDHVVAGNEYLADFFRARGRTVTILPTVVDPAHYRVKEHSQTDSPRLVWIGSHSTLPYLEEFLPAIERAAEQVPGLGLIIIADGSLQSQVVPIEQIPWSVESEAVALAREDIGIAPTPCDPWTLGKCGFKIVQYMASGLPVIASPVGANESLVTAATGLLPESQAQWTQAIIQLARDLELRKRMGCAARQRVEAELSTAHAAEVWAGLLRE